MRKQSFTIGITALLLFSANLVIAQSDRVDMVIRRLMEKRKIPGLQLAIIQNGKIVKSGNYGFANVPDSIPVTDKTVFTLNSTTKVFWEYRSCS